MTMNPFNPFVIVVNKFVTLQVIFVYFIQNTQLVPCICKKSLHKDAKKIMREKTPFCPARWREEELSQTVVLVICLDMDYLDIFPLLTEF